MTLSSLSSLWLLQLLKLISAWATIEILKFPHSLLGFTDEDKYTNGVWNVRNYSLTPTKVDCYIDNKTKLRAFSLVFLDVSLLGFVSMHLFSLCGRTEKLIKDDISRGGQSHTIMYGERLLHCSVIYIYVQINKFVCLSANKELIWWVYWPFRFFFVCLFFDVKGIEFPMAEFVSCIRK